MKTDQLIEALTADLAVKPAPVPRAVGLAIAASLPVAAAILVYGPQIRPDAWALFGVGPRFTFKFVFTLSTAAAALWLVLRLSRPGRTPGPAIAGLIGSAILLAVAVGMEMAALPRTLWMPSLIGDRAVACMLLIPTLAAAPLAALLYAMRSGAPDNPALAGAATGLLAGSIGATLYATHCTNDSPLFVAVWYVIAISAVTVIGSLIGSRVLRW